ncbi:MAG: hypothetical protein ABH812_00535 [bacterium]
MIFYLIIANLVMLLSFFFKLSKLPPEIPFFYSKAAGDAQIADWWFIFLLPLLMNLLFYANSYIYKRYFLGNEFVEKIIYYFKLLLITSFTLIFVKIIFLVT